MVWDVDQIHLAQDRGQRQAVVDTVTNLRVPKQEGNFSTSSATIGYSNLFHGVS
jgi:hypothetical protein